VVRAGAAGAAAGAAGAAADAAGMAVKAGAAAEAAGAAGAAGGAAGAAGAGLAAEDAAGAGLGAGAAGAVGGAAGAVSPDVGEAMHRLIAELYPIHRSITGDGVRETLARLRRLIPLEVHEVPTGTQVLDWTVPKEWKIRGATIRDARGRTVLDLKDSTLHVVGYSVPVRARLPLSELAPRIHTLPEQPDRIPYRTSYYAETWGFCMEHRRFEALEDGEYDVVIDSSLEDGALTYGELVLRGESIDEVLISSHVCHPSLCNDNLSGIAVATYLARALADRPRRYTYRFLFAPVTIGAITWLARNREVVPRIRHGLVLAGVGDAGPIHYKRTRRGSAEIDRAVEHVLACAGEPYGIEAFTPYGYDERQFGSPGFDLAVGCLMRTPHGRYPEYHTSGDNLEFVRPASLAGTLARCLEVVEVLEGNGTYRNTRPWGEPQLGRRGLMDAIGGVDDRGALHMAILWVLNLSDGAHDLLAIAERSGLAFRVVRAAADLLLRHELLEPAGAAVAAGGGGS